LKNISSFIAFRAERNDVVAVIKAVLLDDMTAVFGWMNTAYGRTEQSLFMGEILPMSKP